jgi:hypothetical protein
VARTILHAPDLLQSPRTRLKRFSTRAALVAWFGMMLAIGMSLLVRHSVALPRAKVDVELERAMAALRTPADANMWMAVHVLYADCRCSQRIADHLLTSLRPADLAERVLLVGRNTELENGLAAHGLHVVLVEPEDLATRYHVLAVPMLLVAAPDGSIRYAGGYTTRKQGPDPRDVEIVASARAGQAMATLPIFGCAVSRRLEQVLNPLGLP